MPVYESVYSWMDDRCCTGNVNSKRGSHSRVAENWSRITLDRRKGGQFGRTIEDRLVEIVRAYRFLRPCPRIQKYTGKKTRIRLGLDSQFDKQPTTTRQTSWER